MLTGRPVLCVLHSRPSVLELAEVSNAIERYKTYNKSTVGVHLHSARVRS